MSIKILQGDCRDMLRTLPDKSVQCCVTSPPYFGLRDYGVEGQIGLEPTPDDFVSAMIQVFGSVRRVLKDDGTLWLNLGDSYAGSASNGGQSDFSSSGLKKDGRPEESRLKALSNAKEAERKQPAVKRDLGGLASKNLIGIPWRVAFALQADGWYLRSDIIWHKPNPMPESVTDRPTSAHEHIFLFSKQPRYFYDADAVAESAIRAGDIPGGAKYIGNGMKFNANGKNASSPVAETRNLRNVWTVATQPFSGAHFATFPPALIEPCIKAGSRPSDMVLDPFGGAGTTGMVADRLGRNATLIELNPAYADIAKKRIQQDAGMFSSIDMAGAA